MMPSSHNTSNTADGDLTADKAEHGETLWHAENYAGAEEGAVFKEGYTIPEPLAQRIAAQLPGVRPLRGCYHCGLSGHYARACPTGGSWARESQGRRVKHGGCPKCFVCSLYTRDHVSTSCPLRNPASREAVDSCMNMNCAKQGLLLVGSTRFRNTCRHCNHPMRCWNCGQQGHRLGACTEKRYKPPVYEGMAPREERLQ